MTDPGGSLTAGPVPGDESVDPAGTAVIAHDVGRRWWVVAAIAAIGMVGVVARVLVLRSPAGDLNADEAYTGIESFEVLAGRFPVVLGGTAYTAVFEAYLYAPVVVVFGASITTLKVVPMVFWALASAIAARGAFEQMRSLRPIQGRSHQMPAYTAAVTTLLIMWITPGALMVISTRAYASYASGMAVVALTFVLAARLVDRPDPRPMAAAAVGFLAGIGFWMHPMFLSVVVPILVVVAVVHRDRRRRRTVWSAVVIGGLVGSGPYLVWNVWNRFDSRRLPAEFEGTYLDRLSVFWRELLPRALGLRAADWSWHLPVAAAMVLAVLLGAATLAGAVIVARGSDRPSRWLLASVLASALPMMALFPPLIFSADGRYAIVVFAFIAISISVAIARGLAALSARCDDPANRDDPAHRDDPAPHRRRRVMVVSGLLLAMVWVAGYVVPEGRSWLSTSDAEPNAAVFEALEVLEDGGFNHVFGSYWAVLPVEFVADRRVVAGTFGFQPVRFPERAEVVLAQAPNAVAFVVLPEHERPELLFLPAEDYQRREVGSRVVLWPVDGP